MKTLASTSVSNLSAISRYVRAIVYVAVIVCYLLINVGKLTVLSQFLSGLSLVAILVSLPATGPIACIISTVFLCGGTWMLWEHGVTFQAYIRTFGEMVYLLALFAVLPLLAEPIKLGGYNHAIQTLLNGRVKRVMSLNCLTTALSYVCGSFMSLASIPIMMVSMESAVARYPIKDKQRFMTVSSISGYVLPMFWTPMSGVVGVVLHSLHLEWTALFLPLFLLSIACLVMNWVIFYFIDARGAGTAGIQETQAEHSRVDSPLPRLLQMIFGIAVLVISIVLVEQWLKIGLITVVTLVTVPAAFVWSIALGYGRRFVGEAARQLVTRVPRMADQFAVFLGAGFFAASMRASGFGETANLLFIHLNDTIGSQLLLLLMPVMALITSFIGIHPLVAITLLGESLRPEVLAISSTQLAITLVGSSVLTFMLGPFSGTLGLVQSITRVSAFRLCRWNAPYAAGYFLVLSIVVAMV